MLHACSVDQDPSVNVILVVLLYGSFPGGTNGKEPPANAANMRDVGSIPGSGRSPRGENGNPLQYSWRIPWTEEPGRLQSIGSQRVRHD